MYEKKNYHIIITAILHNVTLECVWCENKTKKTTNIRWDLNRGYCTATRSPPRSVGRSTAVEPVANIFRQKKKVRNNNNYYYYVRFSMNFHKWTNHTRTSRVVIILR